MQPILRTLCVSCAVLPFVFGRGEFGLQPLGSCNSSDKQLRVKREIVCSSLVQSPTSWCGDSYENVTAKRDWPNQAVYMETLLQGLVPATTCLNTSYASDTIAWLNYSQALANISGAWMWTYDEFQVQYYDMPRKPGVRIESPATLGRKCWAFAFLAQIWKSLRSPVIQHVQSAGLNLDGFIQAYDASVPLTMNLCEKVMANCFVNATYDPSRNGTCPEKILQFRAGFTRENLLRKNMVTYPFY